MLLQKKMYGFNMRVLKLLKDLVISYLKPLVGVGTKHKPLLRAENPSLVKVWLESLWIMFLLHWEVHVLMIAAVNFLNEDLDWFCGKRTFVVGAVYMRCNGVETLG